MLPRYPSGAFFSSDRCVVKRCGLDVEYKNVDHC